MQKKFDMSLDYLSPLDIGDVKRFHHEFLELEYSNEHGYGFRDIIFDTDYLSTTLVKRTPTFISQFEVKTGRIVEQEIFLYSEIEFALDATFHLLEIFSPAKDAPKVRAALRPLLQPLTRLSAVNLAPAKVIPKLVKDTNQVSVDKLIVNNFQHREGMIGRFDMKLTRFDLAMGVIEKYAHDVAKATLSIASTDFSEFALTVSRRGRLTIQCEEDQFDQVFLYLKSVLFDKELSEYA